MCLPSNPCRLLIVEDFTSLIELLDNPIQRADFLADGLEYIIAPTLEWAVSILSAPDCIKFDGMLIDPHLPDSHDEKQTLATLCKLAPDAATFVFTGGVDDDFIEYAQQFNVERVILKNEWSVKQLFTLLHYGLGQARARKRLKDERDHWKEATAEALKKSDEVLDKYNRLVEKNTQDVVGSPAVKALKESIINLSKDLKQLAASH